MNIESTNDASPSADPEDSAVTSNDPEKEKKSRLGNAKRKMSKKIKSIKRSFKKK